MRELTALWLPCLLTLDNKCNREASLQQCLIMFKRNLRKFLHHFVTDVVTGTHWYATETKELSKQWPLPANLLRRLFTSKGCLLLTWTNLHGLPGEGQNCHRAPLCRIIGLIQSWIARPLWQGIGYTSAKIRRNRLQTADQLSYSPHFPSGNLCLFPNFKKSFDKQKFESNVEVTVGREAHFADVFFRRAKKVELRPGQLYRVKSRLCEEN